MKDQYPEPDRVGDMPEDGVSAPLVSLEDWQRSAAVLEHTRDAMRTLIEKSGQDPMENPAFRQFLGEIAIHHRQIRALEVQALESQLQDNIDKP